MAKRRIIRIYKNVIYLTQQTCFTLAQTNFPTDTFRFSDSQDIYFAVTSTAFDKVKKILTLQVTDYHPTDYANFNQQLIKDEIHRLHFEKLDWQQLKPLLSIYQETALQEAGLIYNSDLEVNKSKDLLQKDYNIITNSQETTDFPSVREEFTVYFQDAYFDLGFVSFTKQLKNYPQPIHFKIENPHIIPEFNFVKNFFPKAFGNKKQFHVSAIIQSENDRITYVHATSPEIQQIDELVIDSVKRARTLNLTSTPKVITVDKSLFTANDIFDNFDDKAEEGNIFKQSELDIFNFLLESREVRNQKQLQYLAGSKHSPKQKIRFTLKPDFGFLFFIEGETMYHYCWELLNSHATYLWSFDKIERDIYLQYKKIEETINAIREHGREAYKSAYRANQIKTDLNFCIIDHRKINSPLIDSFVEWRHKLNERIV